MKVLHNRKLMKMCYTQNIDTLERLAGVPDEAIVEAYLANGDRDWTRHPYAALHCTLVLWVLVGGYFCGVEFGEWMQGACSTKQHRGSGLLYIATRKSSACLLPSSSRHLFHLFVSAWCANLLWSLFLHLGDGGLGN